MFDGLRAEESVRARVMQLADSEVLSPETSISIVNFARVFGTDWPGASADVDAAKAARALDDIEFLLIDDFDAERRQKESENSDRIQFQLHSIRTYLERKLRVEDQRIENLGTDPRNRGLVITAERTKVRLKDRFDLQMAKLDQIRSVRSNREPVGKGLIFITGGL